jgi:O-antigen/teichoic acid export membrane protein
MDEPASASKFGIRRLGAWLGQGETGTVMRGMAMLAAGSGLGRLVGILVIPLLTRLYTPEDFGVLSVFVALVTIIAPLVTLRYVLALPLSRYDAVALNLLVLSAVLLLVLTGLVTLLLAAWAEPLLTLVSMQVLVPWWWLIPVAVLGTAAYEMLTMWATRRRAYKVMARTQVTQSLGGALVKLGLGVAGMQPLGLLLGQVVAQAGAIGQFLRSFAADFRAGWPRVSLRLMRQVAWRHRAFPAWRVPSQFLLMASMQAPVLFMATMFDAGTTGQFGLALMALTIPVTVIGQSAGNALYGEAANLIKTDRPRVLSIATSVQRRLLLLALPPALVLFFYGELIFALLFGEEWRMAGRFASVLAVAIMFQFTSAPLIQVMNLLRSQAAFLMLNLLRVLGLVAVFWSARALAFDPGQTVLSYAIFAALFYLSLSGFVLRALRRDGQNVAAAKQAARPTGD